MVQIGSNNHIDNRLKSSLIEQIIDKRQPLAERVTTVTKNLNDIYNLLQQVESQRNRLLDKVNEHSTINKLNQLNFSPLINQINSELVSLARLKSRFSRPTLNIGVVGRARQGKSRLLQSLTGLSKAEIPDGDGQHCTGVRSNIYHVTGIETYAEVYFHSEQSFLEEVITPYYQQLNLGSVPHSIELFANTPLPEIDKTSVALDKAKYEHLCKYHQYIDKYRQFFQQTTVRIQKDRIREYVAQDTVEGKRDYYAYLAVQKVDIFCSFPNNDIGKISLVDMPGLGDTGIGDADRLIKTLGEDIDLVLFVRMPKAMGDYWAKEDVDLYDLANSALTDLSIHEWSFMILNHVPITNNYKRCEDLKEDITDKHINVRDMIICNCAEPTETQTKVLDRVLDYLAERIDILDNKYALACQQRLLDIQKNLDSQSAIAKAISGQNRNNDWNRKYILLFSTFWNELAEELEKLTRDMIVQRETKDSNLTSAVTRVIEDCKKNPKIPTVQDILKKRDRLASFEGAYAECQHEVRTNLSERFLHFDDALKDSLETAKSKVVKVLIDSGKLGNIVEGEGSEFLLNLLNKIPEDLSKLIKGFSTLATFELQYRGLIQHRVRKHLDVLTPDRTKYKLNDTFSNLFGQNNTNEQKAQKIYDNLLKAQKEAVENCKKELAQILIEPNQAGFAIVEEFVDRVLRAEGIREEWQVLLQEYAPQVWQEDYDVTNADRQLKQEWIYLVEDIEQKSQVKYFKFSI